MTESFDAVLAKLPASFGMVAVDGTLSCAACDAISKRLAAAHAAEDAEIREILYGTLDRDRDNITTRNLVVVAVNALQLERETGTGARRSRRTGCEAAGLAG